MTSLHTHLPDPVPGSHRALDDDHPPSDRTPNPNHASTRDLPPCPERVYDLKYNLLNYITFLLRYYDGSDVPADVPAPHRRSIRTCLGFYLEVYDRSTHVPQDPPQPTAEKGAHGPRIPPTPSARATQTRSSDTTVLEHATPAAAAAAAAAISGKKHADRIADHPLHRVLPPHMPPHRRLTPREERAAAAAAVVKLDPDIAKTIVLGSGETLNPNSKLLRKLRDERLLDARAEQGEGEDEDEDESESEDEGGEEEEGAAEEAVEEAPGVSAGRSPSSSSPTTHREVGVRDDGGFRAACADVEREAGGLKDELDEWAGEYELDVKTAVLVGLVVLLVVGGALGLVLWAVMCLR